MRYRAYVQDDLVPALGPLRLEELSHWHIAGYAHAQLSGGSVTVRRILATLSSALGDAVRQHRLSHNPARPTVIPRPPNPERQIWTPQEAVRFLAYCHEADPLMADLCEVLIGTGIRKGEALALHWDDVHLTNASSISAAHSRRSTMPASNSPQVSQQQELGRYLAPGS
ncbi:hypothetical protein GCM10010218_06390 [Streptomyces mashuensis]|uniref:Integrase n=1 Tax=Streptomyces mashuensis TaxID=33904 RepID=A0A919AXG1_9ACTN|nr:hypothetical protein GCM10010218_06390 [Streptomyces mashuensis]